MNDLAGTGRLGLQRKIQRFSAKILPRDLRRSAASFHRNFRRARREKMLPRGERWPSAGRRESVTMVRVPWAVSSAVRASRLHREGPRFKSVTAHHCPNSTNCSGEILRLIALADRVGGSLDRIVASGHKFHAGDVVQLVRTLPCHGRGRGFESRRPRHSIANGFIQSTTATLSFSSSVGSASRTTGESFTQDR